MRIELRPDIEALSKQEAESKTKKEDEKTLICICLI